MRYETELPSLPASLNPSLPSYPGRRLDVDLFQGKVDIGQLAPAVAVIRNHVLRVIIFTCGKGMGDGREGGREGNVNHSSLDVGFAEAGSISTHRV